MQTAFDRMEDRAVITWTVMIGILAQHGCSVEVYHYFFPNETEWPLWIKRVFFVHKIISFPKRNPTQVIR